MTDPLIAWTYTLLIRSVNTDGSQSKIWTPPATAGVHIGPPDYEPVEDEYDRLDYSITVAVRGGRPILTVEVLEAGGSILGDSGYDALETVLSDYLAGKTLQVALHSKSGSGTGTLNTWTVSPAAFKASGEIGSTLRTGTAEFVVSANTTTDLTVSGTPTTGAYTLRDWKACKISDRGVENADGVNSGVRRTFEFTALVPQTYWPACDDGSRW